MTFTCGYKPTELDTLYEIELAAFEGTVTTKKQFAKWCEKYTLLVARHRGRPVAFLMLKHGRYSCYVFSLDVHPNFQGRGLGKRLMLDAEKLDATPALRLHVRNDNVRAIQLYLRLGYIITELEKDYYDPGVAGLVMRKVK